MSIFLPVLVILDLLLEGLWESKCTCVFFHPLNINTYKYNQSEGGGHKMSYSTFKLLKECLQKNK